MRVLFVEDNELNRQVVREMLATAGLAVEEAEDGEIGLKRIADGDYDVILMDLRMPGMDGLTAIRHIRALGDHKADIPVVVLTADTGPEIEKRCGEAGADAMVMKPVEMRTLFDAIVSAINLRRGSSTLL